MSIIVVLVLLLLNCIMTLLLYQTRLHGTSTSKSGLWILSGGGLDGDSLCCIYSFRDKKKFLSTHMPIHRILPWFEQNASLKSCHEIQQQKRQLTSGETVDGHVDHLEIHNEAVCYQKQALSGYSENHNSRSCGGSFRSLLSSSAAVIQTTPHTALSIYSEKDGNVILVTELLRCLRPNPKLSCIVISNCGGYWVSDFGSVGGFRQVLLLPVRKNMPMDRIPTNRERFLLQGALLTDGVDLWVPDDEMEDSIEIERTTISSRIHNGVCAMLKLPTIKQSSAASKRNTSRNSMDYAPARNATAGWIGSLENSLAKQVRQEEQRRDYQKLIQRSRYFVLRRNHRSLQLVLQNDNLTSGTEKKKAMTAVLAGLRYRAYPRTSSQIGLVSVTLLVEADMRVLSERLKMIQIQQSTEKRSSCGMPICIVCP